MGLVRTKYVIEFCDLDQPYADEMHELGITYGWSKGEMVPIGNLFTWDYLSEKIALLFREACNEADVPICNVLFHFDW